MEAERNAVNTNKSMLMDIVLVLDATGSMQNLMDAVREKALTLHTGIKSAVEAKNYAVEQMRVKVIAFRDVYMDEDDAFVESKFFVLKDDDGENAEFRSFVENIKAEGGGDEPESALEALHMAMNADFVQPGPGQTARHIIVMLTDASAHPLDHPGRSSCAGYPEGVPADFAGLDAEWNEKMDVKARQMIIAAPNAYPWPSVAAWPHVQYMATDAGWGISSRQFAAVTDCLGDG